MNKVYAFGDSFTFGHELSDCPTNLSPTPSKKSYAALVATYLNFDYQCHAMGAYANNAISRRLVETIDQIDDSDLVLAMWTYPERHEFFLEELGARSLQASDTIPFAVEYFRSVDIKEPVVLYNAAREIYIAQQLLLNKKIKFVFMSSVTNLSLAAKNRANVLFDKIDTDYWLFLEHDLGFTDWATKTLNLTFSGHPPDPAHATLSARIVEKINDKT